MGKSSNINTPTTPSTFPFTGLHFWSRPANSKPPDFISSMYTSTRPRHLDHQTRAHDYVIISAAHWFARPSYLHLDGCLHGCIYCPEPESNITHFPPLYAYRTAFRTAFCSINNAAGFDGVTFVRTVAPNHFEGGPWNKGGDCRRTRPFTRNESEAVARDSLEPYTVQVEEMRMAEKSGRRNGGKYVLFDVTKALTLRPDGHPSKYGSFPGAKLEMPNDCVHWCLPGPIDAWSDLLQELLKRETRDGI